MRRSLSLPRPLLILLLALPACVHVEDVPGPDGETAHLIHCPQTSSCLEKARDVCPDGYLIRTGSRVVRGSSAMESDELLVSCNADLPSTSQASSAPPGVDPEREDKRVCEAASQHAAEFGAYWVAHSPNGRALDELPQPRDFVVTCRALPEPVQRCMHALYRQAHDQACEGLFSRLEPSPRTKIDGLFLAAPPARPATTPKAPGLSL